MTQGGSGTNILVDGAGSLLNIKGNATIGATTAGQHDLALSNGGTAIFEGTTTLFGDGGPTGGDTTVTVTNGSVLQTGYASIAQEVGAQAAVNLSGSTWTPGQINVAVFGTGQFSLSDASTATTNWLFTGWREGSDAEILVQSGSSLQVNTVARLGYEGKSFWASGRNPPFRSIPPPSVMRLPVMGWWR